MSSTAILSATKRARRSKRLGLSIPVVVHGNDMSGTAFRELTRAGCLNANGAQLTLSCLVGLRQSIFVVNQNTREEQECRVVNVSVGESGKWKVGVEFTRSAEGFWEIYFPALLRAR